MAGKILVLGGTGHVGRPLVAALVARGEAVKVASRQGTASGGAEGVRFDYGDPSTFPGALDGVDRVYVITPGGHVDIVPLLTPVLTAAAEKGVKLVLQTAKGVDADESIPYRQVERFVERSFSRWAVLRPDWFADNFHTFWQGAVKAGDIRLPAADGKSGFVAVDDIAASAAAVLASDRFDNRAYVLTGPEALSYAEAAAILSQALARPVAYTPVEPEVFVAQMIGFGVPETYARFLASLFHVVAQGWAAGLSGDVETLTGRQPTSLAAYAAAHKADLLA